ncbi:Suppressor of glycerol defect protein1with MIF4G superfamily conserved domain [Kluyveromyces marxianus]
MSKKHSIRLPGVLLDELKGQNYDEDDSRFQTPKVKSSGRNGKRKAPLGRKELRKQQRESKKAKRSGKSDSHPVKKTQHEVKKVSKVQDTIRKNQKSSTSKKSESKPKQVRFAEKDEVKVFSSDDELSASDFDEFSEGDLDEEEWEQLRELEGDDEDEDEDEDEDQPLTAEETMMKLKELKEKKLKSNGNGNNKTGMATPDVDSDDDDQLSSDYSDIDEDDDEDQPLTAEETMMKLKELKEKKMKNSNNSKATTAAPDVDSDDGDELLSSEYSDAEDDEGDDKEMTVEETMAALKAMKEKKQKSKSHDMKPKKNTTQSKKDKTYAPLTPQERAAIERDEQDMKYYARKLGLKKNKLHAADEYDAIGGLLEGLDYFENFGEEGEEDEEDEIMSEEDNEDEIISEGEDEIISGNEEEEEEVENPFSSDDELSSGDFDEFSEGDLDEEEWEQLRELEGGKPSKAPKEKENIYTAPVSDTSQAYIPPSLRKKQLEDSDSETYKELKKKVKSLLNKLSDSNITVIVTSLNELYDNYARQYVNDAINNQIIEVVAQKNKLLDTFIMSYAGVAFSMWKLKGTEAGASFIQALVQKFLDIYNEQMEFIQSKGPNPEEAMLISKEATNLLTLLSYSYNFGLVSSRLIYDIIKELIQNPNEYTTELLLRIISVSGSLIRGDDPRALKDIISELLNNVKGLKQTSRLSFLLETLTDLKNNRLKPSVMAASHQSLKKTIIGSLRISTSASSEPLLASLDDIKNVETKGKWWLIGASWKGNQETAFDEVKKTNTDNSIDTKLNIKLEDNLLSEIIDWNEVARQQRMNTDVRRAIFVSIMSAEDYLDAFAKLEKLNLKSKQSLDITRVLVHCLCNDGATIGYNPFYSLLAAKLSEHNHKLLKSFQFLFWEIVKKFETESYSDDEKEDTLFNNDSLDEDAKLQTLAKQGRFFGFLIANGSLKLDIFKHVPLMGGINSDGFVFFEILLFQMFLTIGKTAEKKVKKDGKKSFEYNSNELLSLIDNGITNENKTVILKALKWFINKHFEYTKYISGVEGSKDYERESRRLSWAVNTFKSLIDDALKTSDF